MPLVRILFIITGTISFVLGIIGVFVPLLPTTPFLLLSAFLYSKSSTRCHDWLLRQPYLGEYIKDFNENKIIPVRAKVISTSLMWACILYCMFFIVINIWIKMLLALVAIGVTWHILSFKSKRP